MLQNVVMVKKLPQSELIIDFGGLQEGQKW
jgi:hypothetical protein